MAKITIDGIPMDVPDCVTTDHLLDHLLPSGGNRSMVYEIKDGQHRLLRLGEQLQVRDGDRFGTLEPFTTAGEKLRNIEQIKAEIKLLECSYGGNNVEWAPNYDWLLVREFKLPPNFNRPKCCVLVLVPEHYGYGESFRDFFLPQGLLIWHHGKWERLPHYFEKFPYATLDTTLVTELSEKGWSYLCLHPARWGKLNNILTFFSQVYTFLCDPFLDWNELWSKK